MLFFILISLCIFPLITNAVFTIEEAEEKIGDGQTYLEILDDNGNVIIDAIIIDDVTLRSSPGKKWLYSFSYEYSGDIPKNIQIHSLTQYVGMTKEASGQVESTERLNASIEKVVYDNKGINGVEMLVNASINEAIYDGNKAKIHYSCKWGIYEFGINISFLQCSEFEKKIEEDLDNAEETKKEMIDAWKNGPPSAEASVSEIHDFVAGYAMEVSSKSTEEEKNKIKNEFAEKVSIDVAKKWREVLDDAMIDTISRDMYYEERQILDDYIDGNLDSNVIDTSAKEQMDAIDATEKTISEYMELIATIKAAARKEHANFTDVLESIGDYIPTNQDAPTKLINKANIILTIITNIGMILSVIVIAILGIKYMLGSVEEKAEYKKDLIPYFVGAVLLFSIIAIVKILQEFGQSINNI